MKVSIFKLALLEYCKSRLFFVVFSVSPEELRFFPLLEYESEVILTATRASHIIS